MRPSEMEGLPSPQQVQEEDHAPRTSFSPKPAHQPSPKRALPSSMLEEKDSDHVVQNNKPELKASSNPEQAPETTSMPPKHSKAAPPRIPGRRKRTKKPPPSGTFGFSKGTETLVILTSLNVFAYLLHILNGWHWYGLVVVLNCLCFQILKNKDQVDQWDEQTPSKRRASLVTATGEVGNMASIKNHKGQGQNAMGSVVPSELPRAGNTMIPVELTESEREAEEPPHHTPVNTWSNGCGQHFTVRSKNYSKTKKKTPSGKALYNLVAADFFEVDARVNHIAADFQMPKASVEFSHSHIPQFIVVNVQLPSTAPSMMSSETDGPGYQVVHYFEIAPETVEELKHPDTASEGTRLLEEYCMKAEHDDKFRGRFKVIGILRNPKDLNLPSFITNYNGKPVLINKSGRLFRGPNYLEMDVNVHNFSYLAKKGLFYMQSKFIQAYLNVGFVIEGRGNDQQPEKMIGCAQFNCPDMTKALKLDVFD